MATLSVPVLYAYTMAKLAVPVYLGCHHMVSLAVTTVPSFMCHVLSLLFGVISSFDVVTCCHYSYVSHCPFAIVSEADHSIKIESTSSLGILSFPRWDTIILEPFGTSFVRLFSRS